jgi:hypothetical protein
VHVGAVSVVVIVIVLLLLARLTTSIRRAGRMRYRGPDWSPGGFDPPGQDGQQWNSDGAFGGSHAGGDDGSGHHGGGDVGGGHHGGWSGGGGDGGGWSGGGGGDVGGGHHG